MTTPQRSSLADEQRVQKVHDVSRRRFLKQGSLASAAVTIGLASEAKAENSSALETINIGIVGTGGRGGGAARDTLSINPNVRIIAMSISILKSVSRCEKVWPADTTNVSRCRTKIFLADSMVTDESLNTRCRLGSFDPRRQVFAHPMWPRLSRLANMFLRRSRRASIQQATVFALRQIVKARKQGTAIVTGTQYRRQKNYMEVMRRIHEGQIGDVISATSRYCTSGIWNRPRKPGNERCRIPTLQLDAFHLALRGSNC